MGISYETNVNMGPKILDLESTDAPDVCEGLHLQQLDKLRPERNGSAWRDPSTKGVFQNAEDRTAPCRSTRTGQCSVPVPQCHVIDDINRIRYNMCASCAGRLALYSCSADAAESAKRGHHGRRSEVAVGAREEEEQQQEEDEAPDGGWGWVVTFGCFIIAVSYGFVFASRCSWAWECMSVCFDARDPSSKRESLAPYFKTRPELLLKLLTPLPRSSRSRM